MKIMALLQARNEERYLRGWLENVAPAVDGIVALDDGSTDGTRELLAAHPKLLALLTNPAGQAWNEYANQVGLLKAGRQHGATWFLCLDADERLEERLVNDIRPILLEAERRGVDALAIQFRDLWDDRRQYRVDGDWGTRARYRLFRNLPNQNKFDPRRLHRHWMPLELVANLKTAGAHLPYAIYHLRMIRPVDREARYRRYLALDPGNRYQQKGYEHMMDESGLELAPVTPERDFLPRDEVALAD